ncbi:MAG: RidA family protein [Rhodothermia bacterium]|nr:MAG: RidA family protein [Rhodothermia bacterium]
MKLIYLLPLLLIFVLGACQDSEEYDDHDEFLIQYPDQAESVGPFSDAVRVGHMLYLSGNIGFAPGEGLVEGGIQEETRQTLENISATLAKYGSSMNEVVKCTVMLADIGEWGAMNEVYTTFFSDHKPARSAFGASGLALNSRVEIECMATVQ